MKKIILVLLLQSATVYAHSQHIDNQPKKNKEHQQAMKVGFLTNTLDLTSEEAAAFWPVYNRYDSERRAIAAINRTSKKSVENEKNVTAGEAEKLLELQLTNEQKLVDVKKKYLAEFKTILPANKIVILYKSEAQFRKIKNHKKIKHTAKAKQKNKNSVPPHPPK